MSLLLLWLVAQTPLGGYLRFEAYAQTRSPYTLQKLALTFQQRLDLEGDQVHGYGAFNVIFDALENRWILRPIEGYITASFGPADLTLGKRILTWGEGVFVSPSDVVTPWNFTFLYSDLEEFREGVELAGLTLYHGPFWLQGAFLPFFHPNRYPVPPIYTPVFAFEPDSARRPSASLKNGGALLRLGGTLGPVDFQVFGYRGYDPDPDLLHRFVFNFSWTTLAYHRATFVGGNAVYIWGARAIHLDFVYRRSPEQPAAPPGAVEWEEYKAPLFFGAIGAETSAWNDQLSLGLDYLYRRNFWPGDTVPQRSDLAQDLFFEDFDGVSYLAYRLQWHDARELWRLQVMGIYDLKNKEAFTLPSLSYSLADGVNLRVGGLFSGTQGKSPFTQMGKTLGNLAFTEVRWSF